MVSCLSLTLTEVGENGVLGGRRGDSLSGQAVQEEPGKSRVCNSGPGGLGLWAGGLSPLCFSSLIYFLAPVWHLHPHHNQGLGGSSWHLP